jgi:hypothetical protein
MSQKSVEEIQNIQKHRFWIQFRSPTGKKVLIDLKGVVIYELERGLTAVRFDSWTWLEENARPLNETSKILLNVLLYRMMVEWEYGIINTSLPDCEYAIKVCEAIINEDYGEDDLTANPPFADEKLMEN